MTDKKAIKKLIQDIGEDTIFIYGVKIFKYQDEGVVYYHLSNHYVDDIFLKIDDVVDFLLDYSTWEL